MKLLIDGDIVVYRCAFAAESAIYYLYADEEAPPIAGPFSSARERNAYIKENGLNKDELIIVKEKEVEPVENALANVKSVLNDIIDKLGSDDYRIFLSEGECYRGNIATMQKYKGNRDDAPRPVHYDAVRKYMTDVWNAETCKVIEADDALAMLQRDPPETCIVSIDKDLLQVPGWHYNWVTEERTEVSEEVGIRLLYAQLLKGDATDNIPGIRGIGDKKAAQLVSQIEYGPDFVQRLWDMCVAEWQKYMEKGIDGFECHASEEDELAFYYTPYFVDIPMQTGPEEIAYEVLSLLKVGGGHAKKALEESNEEVLTA